MSIISPGYFDHVVAASTVYSWNPHVACNPVVLTIEQVLGNQSSSLGGALEAGSPFAPGIANKRSLSFPCTITNTQGQIVSVFVQINNVLLVSPTNEEDCSTTFNSSNGGGLYPNGNLYCDTDQNLHTLGHSGNCSSTDTSGCMHRIFFEIDRDWKAAGYCGTGTVCDNSTMHQLTTSTLIDVQGFLYWNPSDTTQSWHSFSGWEVHPLTAWKLSSSPPPPPPPPILTVGFTWSPTTPQPGQQASFRSGVFGGTPPYMLSWNFGDGGTLVSSSSDATHTYSSSATYNVTLTVTDSLGVTGHASNPLLIPLMTSISWNPHIACTPLVVTIEELLGQPNSSGVDSKTASAFSPGVPNKRTLSQPCTITNADGQVIGAFVEIRGVERDYLFESDWATSYDSSNGGGAYPPCPGQPCIEGDTNVHIYNPAFSPICSAGSPSCMHILQVEIDHDWKAAGYCGTGTVCGNSTLSSQTIPFSTVLDVQGYVYWDPDHVAEASHSFSGWEIHPLTGWRESGQPVFTGSVSRMLRT